MKAFQIGLLIFFLMGMLSQAYSQGSCGQPPKPPAPPKQPCPGCGSPSGGPKGGGASNGGGGQNGGQGSGGGGGGSTTSSSGGDEINITLVISVDPNEIAGPVGYGPAQWVAAKDVLGYTILFENDPDFATAPAQIVKITQAIDPKMNPLSFRLSDFGFGSFTFAVPGNASFYSDRLDLRDSLGIYVDVTAGVDIINNQFFWIFESIDPVTGLAPFDAFKGFLPVNDTLLKNGEGFVTYTVVPVASAVTGDSIVARASIVFDINAPIETNTWKNRIDAGAPVSVLNSVPAVAPGNFIELSWSATDDPGGVGVGLYDLYVSKNGEPAFVHTSGIDSTHFLFTGEAAATYGFFVLSTDLVGNPEQPKDSIEQTTKLGNDSLLLLQPVAGSTYCYGSLLEIQWFAKGLSGIDIEIYDAGLGDFVPIQSNVNPFFGGVSWIVPDGFSCNNCQVRISSTSDSTLSVLSLPFTILSAGVDTTDLQVFTCNPGDVGITTLVLTTEAGCDSLVITNTVLETMPPTALCRDIAVQLDLSGAATIPADTVNNGSTDDCGLAGFSLSHTTFDCTDIGAQTATLTVTDNNGNSATCTATITVEDSGATWYLDTDNDGYFTGTGLRQCASPGAGYQSAGLLGGGDCDDDDPDIYPGAPESCNGFDDNCNGDVDENAPTFVQAKVLLQGPYISAQQLMHDSLRVKNLIPLTEPYTGLSNFTHVGGGGETTTTDVLAVTGVNAIVDWIFLELRNSANPAQVLATRSALLQRDGDVVEVDGVSSVAFPIATGQDYFLAVRHRNHFGVQSGGTDTYPPCIAVESDFRSLPVDDFFQFNGLNPAQRLIGDKYVLWAGNGRVDYQLKYNGSNNDRTAILSVVGLATPNAIIPGYRLADYNMDGSVKYNGSANDRNVLLGNVGITTPSVILYDQIGQ